MQHQPAALCPVRPDNSKLFAARTGHRVAATQYFAKKVACDVTLQLRQGHQAETYVALISLQLLDGCKAGYVNGWLADSG